MDGKTSIRLRIRPRTLGTALSLGLATLLLTPAVHGQATQNAPNALDRAMAALKWEELSTSDVEVIAKAKAVQAIPALEEQFARNADLNLKFEIASGLVRLGDHDSRYWDFVLQQATLAVDSDLPEPFRDAQGNPTGRQLSPEFKAWIEAHHVDASTAIESSISDFPGRVLVLGETGDPRGIPLLRRALHSRNLLIVVIAADGLAQTQDKQSISLILGAIQEARPDYRPLIAESLVYFDDPLAQNAVDSYMTKEQAANAREARSRGKGVFGW